jgi:hypothetical protein
MISLVKLMFPLTKFISLTSLLNLGGTPPEAPTLAPPFESVLVFYAESDGALGYAAAFGFFA